MKKVIHVETIIGAPREAVFDFAATNSDNIKLIFPGMPPLIPSVQGASIVGNGPCAAGVLRNIQLGDGSTIQEKVLDFEVPSRHHYRVVKMTAAQNMIFNQLESNWIFESFSGGTKVSWTYTVGFKSVFLFPLAMLLGWAMRKCMVDCHRIIKRETEK